MSEDKIKKLLSQGYYVTAWKEGEKKDQMLTYAKSKKAAISQLVKRYPDYTKDDFAKMAVHCPLKDKKVVLTNTTYHTKSATIAGYNGVVTIRNTLSPTFGDSVTTMTLTMDDLVKIVKNHPQKHTLISAMRG